MPIRKRFLAGAGGLWVLLLIPSVPLSQHQCFGFIGFLAHSPLYAFSALTAGLLAVGVLFSVRRLAAAFSVRLPRGAALSRE